MCPLQWPRWTRGISGCSTAGRGYQRTRGFRRCSVGSALGEREIGAVLVFIRVAKQVEKPRPRGHQHAGGARFLVLAEREIPLRTSLRTREESPQLGWRRGSVAGCALPYRTAGRGRDTGEYETARRRPGPRCRLVFLRFQD